MTHLKWSITHLIFTSCRPCSRSNDVCEVQDPGRFILRVTRQDDRTLRDIPFLCLLTRGRIITEYKGITRCHGYFHRKMNVEAAELNATEEGKVCLHLTIYVPNMSEI